MALNLNQLGQISQIVDDVDAAERFYSETLGLRKLYRFGDLLFFDCAGVRLLVEKIPDQAFTPGNTILYFRVADMFLSYAALQEMQVTFIDAPHLVAPMPDHDLWMVFFKDPAGNTLALMQEAPKGYEPG